MLTQTNRIQKDLETLASYTSTPGHGVTRSSYSKEDTMDKEYLIKEKDLRQPLPHVSVIKQISR